MEFKTYSMKVVILCGGLGTRLREETEYRPKPMVPVGGRPMLWHIMKYYAHFGHKDFILCLGYKGEVIKDYFRNYHWNTSDVTLKLERNPQIAHRRSLTEENWTVPLLGVRGAPSSDLAGGTAAHCPLLLRRTKCCRSRGGVGGAGGVRSQTHQRLSACLKRPTSSRAIAPATTVGPPRF